MNAAVIFSGIALWTVGSLGPVLGALIVLAAAILCMLINFCGAQTGWIKNICLVFISTCLTLSVSDLILRLVIGNSRYHRPHEMFLEHSPEYRGALRYQPNVNYKGQASGDLAARAKLQDQNLKVVHQENFRTDELGFPNPPGSAQKDNCAVVLGDSFVAGLGISWQENWVTKLQQQMHCPFYNLGLPGSPADELYTLTRQISRIKLLPEALLIWTIFTGNDITESYAALEFVDNDKPLQSWESLLISLEDFQRRSPIREFWLTPFARQQMSSEIERIKTWKGTDMLIIKSYKDSVLSDLKRVHAHQNWAPFVTTLERMHEFARARRLRILVFIIPSKEEVYENSAQALTQSGIAQAILAECSRLQLACHDIKPSIYQAALEESEPIWRTDDTHWNELGHDHMAKIVADQIDRTNTLPSK